MDICSLKKALSVNSGFTLGAGVDKELRDPLAKKLRDLVPQ